MLLNEKDIIDFVLISFISLLSISWCFLLFAIINPQKAILIAGMFSNTHSMRKSLKPLEMPIETERVIYKNHKVFGLVVTLLSVYILYNLQLGMDGQLIVDLIDNPKYNVLSEIIFETLVLVLSIGSIFSLFVGVIIAFRPSLLKKLEAKSNIWLSTRNAMRGLESKHSGIESYFIKNTKKVVIPLLILCTVLIVVLMQITTSIRV